MIDPLDDTEKIVFGGALQDDFLRVDDDQNVHSALPTRIQ
jgi:hypothetical protein